MTNAEKRAKVRIMNMPAGALSPAEYREWLRLTLWYGAHARGIAPSDEAIQMRIDKIGPDSMSGLTQAAIAAQVIRDQGAMIDKVRQELAEETHD
jgi:hypothetical protein